MYHFFAQVITQPSHRETLYLLNLFKESESSQVKEKLSCKAFNANVL